MIRNTIRAVASVLFLVAAAPTPLLGQITDAHSQPLSPVVQPAAAPKPVAHPTRRLEEDELLLLLTDALKQQLETQGADLEIHLIRPWKAVAAPEGSLSVEMLDSPATHLASTCLVRFQLRGEGQVVGPWVLPLQAHLWREVPVARGPLRRGQPFQASDFSLERRDLLTLHDPVFELPHEGAASELAENLVAGAPLTTRAIRLRPVVFRGQTADAIVRDGAMQISLKVEVLEEGVPGQMVRVRNIASRRELQGKVEDDQTISIPL